eukprot:GILJ01031750.1.p1 GENE.GILJ01031750.1~~GILJ01031750.1.p1  ORF type:complete len:129 (+),score=9.99 GILJ01031750.1:109-495(+)
MTSLVRTSPQAPAAGGADPREISMKSGIDVIVGELVPHFLEFYAKKVVTPTKSELVVLAEEYRDIMTPIINSKPFYRFNGSIGVILCVSITVEEFERLVRKAFADPRRPLPSSTLTGSCGRNQSKKII